MSENEKNTPYRVLARKYRPQSFDDLYGQEALVRTLKNAIESERIAQAYMLTGVRGVGKTTTARLIAKALNYTGADGKAGPTTGATDDCELCQAITEDRHPDVMEMDAASRTGIDDIREILDGVRYAPTQARYKVYIIDEIHMLSKQAFNALLKTLEEPPAHVIFIFATTEIRRVPVTVLSRCQRFDLNRMDVNTLSALYTDICGKENVEIEDAATALIARAADGSARDGLSLLDQAISLSSGNKITAEQIQDMLGLADRSRVLDIVDTSLKGNCAEALKIAADLYSKGADPVVLMQDMLDFVHLLTRLKAVPDQKETSSAMAQDTVNRAAELSAQLSMPSLGRAWQLLLKGLNEINNAPNPQAAVEMIIIRLNYAANLPDPGELLKKLKNAKDDVANVSAPPPPSPVKESVIAQNNIGSGGGNAAVAVQTAPIVTPETTAPPEAITDCASLEAALRAKGQLMLAGQVHQYMHLVKLEEGRIEFRPAENAPPAFATGLGKALLNITGERWMVTVSGAAGQPTLAEQTETAAQSLLDEARELPIVKKVIELFPEAKLSVKRQDEE